MITDNMTFFISVHQEKPMINRMFLNFSKPN